jgi:hypothetical protein
MALKNGRKVVTTTGTRVQLTTVSVPIRSVALTAETDNTGDVVIGGSTVVAALATREGTPLAAGQTMTLTKNDDGVDELSDVWLDSIVSGDGVTYTYGEA